MNSQPVHSGADKKNRQGSEHGQSGTSHSPYSSLSGILEKNNGSEAMVTDGGDYLEDDSKNRGCGAYFCEPRSSDICCGQGKGYLCHPGNLIFHEVIQKNLDSYEKADSKGSRIASIAAIVDSLHVEHNARFIKKDPAVGKWFVVTLSEARDKTGHAIRNQLGRMKQRQVSLQEKASSSTIQTTVSCSISTVKRKLERNTNKRAKKRVAPAKSKRQDQKKFKIITDSTSQLGLFEEEKSETSFPSLGDEELHGLLSNDCLGRDTVDHSQFLPHGDSFQLDMATNMLGLHVQQRPQGSHVVPVEEIVVPMKQFGHEISFHRDFDQCDDLAANMVDHHAPCLPQGRHAVSVENTSHVSVLPNESLLNNKLPHQVSPEINRGPLTLQANHEFHIRSDDLEPYPLLPDVPFPVHYIHMSQRSGMTDRSAKDIGDSPGPRAEI